jgi:hypothetical protein
VGGRIRREAVVGDGRIVGGASEAEGQVRVKKGGRVVMGGEEASRVVSACCGRVSVAAMEGDRRHQEARQVVVALGSTKT